MSGALSSTRGEALDFIVLQFLTGLASASSLFLIAAGLSIVFGVTRVVNFAHGSFTMLGAYVAFSLTSRLEAAGPAGFWLGVLGAAVAVALVGLVVETTLLRRIYASPELFQLLATFGLVLVIQDLTRTLWGSEDLLGPRAPGLDGAVSILGAPFPQYELMLVALGPLALGALWLLFRHTRFGILVRAATEDREMVGALGVNQKLLFTAVFVLGAFVAGLGGALQMPRQAASLSMDLGIIVEVFVVVVIGGMGSIVGAFLAAVLVAEVHAFGIVVFPEATLVLLFLVMAAVLVVRPHGLLGRPEAPRAAMPAVAGETPLRPPAPRGAVALVAALAAAPLVLGDYGLIVLTEVMIFALFASSLRFVMGAGGLVSFGHAAYFGLGAYAVALAMHWGGAGMPAALAAAPVTAGVGGLVFGWFCVRLSGIYRAMLTLAFAQILWSVAVQWIAVTGGDNGILGVWPAEWARGPVPFFYLTLALSGGGIALLRRVTWAPFGAFLRAGRDSRSRAEAIGLDVRAHQWLGFALAAAFAGLAGGLYALSKGNVFPDALAVPHSVEALVMVLLGGVQAVAGPLAGALAYVLLEDNVSRLTGHWQLVLGVAILVMVVAFPRGLAGFARRRAA